MSQKMTGISRDQLVMLTRQNHFQPAFTDEVCYIATGPGYEILAVLRADGLFDVQLLDKDLAALSVNETIRAFRQFVNQVKLAQPR